MIEASTFTWCSYITHWVRGHSCVGSGHSSIGTWPLDSCTAVTGSQWL